MSSAQISSTEAPVAFAPWDPEARRNPYAHFAALREHDPVHRFELLMGWIVSRYDDAVSVLRDDARFSSQVHSATIEQLARARQRDLPAEQRIALDAFFEHSLLFIDRPRHTRLRGLVTRGFTPRVVTELRPRIQAIVDELVDDMLERGSADFVRDFADPLPARIIAELLGVPAADRDHFKQWSDGLVVLFDPIKAPDREAHARECAREMKSYLHQLFAERRERPDDDLVSALVELERNADSLQEIELFAMCMLLLVAGHETTTNLLGNGLYTLLEHPDQLARLRQDPGLVRSGVEELLRYESPVQGMPRVATQDLELRGRKVSKGDYVVVLVGAANHDPEQFANPETLDVGRRENRHLAFGYGAHFCLGAPLARAEAEIAFSTLLRRAPRIRAEYGEVEWKPTITLRGVASLPVSF